MKPSDLGVAKRKALGEDFVGVLAEGRRRGANRSLCVRHLDRYAKHLDRARCGVLESLDHVARFEVRIAEGTGYMPHTMMVVPLVRDGAAIGALSVLDRRDGRPYGPADLDRARLFADLTVEALEAGGVRL